MTNGVLVVIDVVFLASGGDVLIVVDLFIFMVLGWINAFSSTPCYGHNFSSNFHK